MEWNKAPGHDGVQGFWIKRLDKMHERIATQLNEIVEGTKEIPSWMTYAKGNSVENFRPMTCLPLMWKTKTYFQRSKSAAGGKAEE